MNRISRFAVPGLTGPRMLVLATAAALLAVPVVVAPGLALLAFVAVGIAVAVIVHPPAAAYVLLGVTPLIAGVDRGSLPVGNLPLLSLLRPHEALAFYVGGVLILASLARTRAHPVRLRVTKVDLAIIGLAFAGSVLPLLWMLARGNELTQDDTLYALNIWKYYALFLLVRGSVRQERDVQRCLWFSMIAAGIVAVIAVLQALQLFGVPRLLAQYYAPYGDEHALQINRGTTTLASSIATGDIMVFNLAIALAWIPHAARHRSVLMGAAGLFVLGALASGQYSAVIALVVVVVSIGLLTGRLARKTLAFLPAALASGLILQPVIKRRTSGFSSAEGLPPSWLGRWQNLSENFWPTLFSDFNYILGVRPAARIPVSDEWRDYAWIESGHTWLLWSGGIPFLLAFFVFLWITISATARTARSRVDAVGIAASAAFCALVVVGVLMILDAHLILRGAGDLLFSLLALSLTAPLADSPSPAAQPPPHRASDTVPVPV